MIDNYKCVDVSEGNKLNLNSKYIIGDLVKFRLSEGRKSYSKITKVLLKTDSSNRVYFTYVTENNKTIGHGDVVSLEVRYDE